MPQFKRINEYEDHELEAAIKEAQAIMGTDNFWTILKGFDSYFEKRRRRLEKEAKANKYNHNDTGDA